MFNNNTFIVKNEMTTCKITPDFNVSNTKNEVLTNTFSNLYETAMKRVSFSNINIKNQNQVHFNIVLEDRNVNFYLSSPTQYKDLIESKAQSCWRSCAFDNVDDVSHLVMDTKNTVGAELKLSDYNVNSISTDLSDTSHLISLMQVLKAVSNDDKIIINIAIESMPRFNWLSIVEDEGKLIKSGIQKATSCDFVSMLTKTAGKVGSEAIGLYIEYKLLPFEILLGMANDGGDEIFNIKKGDQEMADKLERKDNRKSSSTFKKNSDVFKCKISILSSSPDSHKAQLNLLSVFESFKELNGDNEFYLKELSHKNVISRSREIKSYHIPMNNQCILSTKEVAKLIQLPLKKTQKDFKIKALDNTDSQIPSKLKNGNTVIGIASSKGIETPVYRSLDKSLRCLPWIAIGSQNAGKTTLMMRIAYQNFLAGDSNLIIDTIEDCKLAKACRNSIPKDKRVDIKISKSNLTNVPSFSFNEISNLIHDGMDSFERISLASDIAEQIQLIIENVSDDSNGTLTDPMIRYLYSASVVAFVKPGATLQDVFNILKKPDVRHSAIVHAKSLKCFEDEDVFFNLYQLDKEVEYKEKELDEKGKEVAVKKTRIENNNQAIIGILNRITSLEKVPYIKRMLAQKPSKNEDFLKYIEEGKTIVVSVEQNEFKSKKIRDMIGLYYFSRIWLAVQSRKNNDVAIPCHVFYDEVATIPTTIKFISNIVTEMRRHRLGFFTTCHTLSQFGDKLESFKSAGGSYIMIQSTIKDSFDLLKEEVKPFELDDLLELKQHHALVIQRYEDGYARYICKLPDFKPSTLKVENKKD